MNKLLEHPDITTVNRYGYVEPIHIIGHCENCNASIHDGQKEVLSFHDDLFCDLDCLVEKFVETPSRYGVETVDF